MTDSALDTLFEAVRTACTPASWSRGVELTRAGAVSAEPATADEARFRISARGGMTSWAVTLFPGDAEWQCRCGSRDAACEHVAAAVIAWRRSEREGTELRSPDAAGSVTYRFERTPSGLALRREIARAGVAHPLDATLSAVATGKVAGPAFVAEQADLAVELALGTHRRGLLATRLVAPLFARLQKCKDVQLDGRPIRVDPQPVLPIAVVEDQADGFRLSVVPDPAASEHFDNGIVRCGDVLRPLGDPLLSGREQHELPRGRHFSRAEAGELVTVVLPALARRLPVEVRTARLPGTIEEPPRVQLETRREGERLDVLATLVYGDPPRARIDGGQLVVLRDGPVPLRDEPAERRLVRRLRHELGLAPGVREEYAGERAVAFCSRLGSWNREVRGRDHEHFRLAAPLVPNVGLEGSRFRVEFESRSEDGSSKPASRADPAAVLRAWRAGESLVPLLGGGYAPLPRDWLERHGQRLIDLLEARRADGTLPPSVARDLARLCEDLDLAPPPDLGRAREVLERTGGIPPAEFPADLTASLRPYQRAGVDWLVWMRRAGLGALLADDMGLGKTLQALCAIAGRTLVVAPTSVLHNWEDELRRFRPGLRASVYHGPGRALDPTADVTLTTYAILRLDAERLTAERWSTVVLDEAQAIKNPESQVADAAFRLQADSRMTLTGTPVENRLDELWSQFHFLDRGLLGGRSSFEERYAAPIAAGDLAAAARLRERIRPFILRRLKADVAADLPPRTEIVLHCELEPAERELYETIRGSTRADVVAQLEAGGSVLAALEALLRLRQAACHPALVPGQHAAGSSKVELLLETLDSVVAEGHKALVFSQWTSFLDLVEPHLERAALGYARLDGSTRDRAGVVRGFQDPGGPPVLLVSLKAGGSGLNLTAADHVFLLDLWWNPAVEQQAADRAHRIGQTRPVVVYRLVAEDTVEERILALQARKREVAETALGDADQAATLGRRELLELLR